MSTLYGNSFDAHGATEIESDIALYGNVISVSAYDSSVIPLPAAFGIDASNMKRYVVVMGKTEHPNVKVDVTFSKNATIL